MDSSFGAPRHGDADLKRREAGTRGLGDLGAEALRNQAAQSFSDGDRTQTSIFFGQRHQRSSGEKLGDSSGREAAVEMAKELMGRLGEELVGLHPELRYAQVVPIMGHDAVRASPESRTYALSQSLGFGTVNAGIVTHKPRGAVKEFTNANDRTKLLHAKYTADMTSLPSPSDDAGPLDIARSASGEH